MSDTVGNNLGALVPLPSTEDLRALRDGGQRRPFPVNGGSPDATVRLTVIVPTRNELENVPVLMERLGPAIAPLSAEIIVVDDSDDDTPAALARHAGDCPVPIRLLHRPPGHSGGGLSGAVIAGARHARGD